MGHYATEVTPATDGDVWTYRAAPTKGLVGPRRAARVRPGARFPGYWLPAPRPPDRPARPARVR
eukprot:7041696-Lingulodinium_polyedra.AAC.1